MTLRIGRSWEFIHTMLFGVVATWLFAVTAVIPSPESEKVLPAAIPATAALSVLAAAGLAIARRRIHFGTTDLFALFTMLCMVRDALIRSCEHPHYDKFIQTATAYVALRSIFATVRRSKETMILVLFALAICESIVGIRQVFGLTDSNHNLFRLTGSLFNPGPYGGLIAPIAACAAGFLLLQNDRLRQLLNSKPHVPDSRPAATLATYTTTAATCAVVVSTIVLPATMSRAAWIAAVGGIGLPLVCKSSLLQRFRTYWIRHRLRAALLAGSISLFITATAAGIYGVKRTSADGRRLIWKIDTRIIAKHPFCGVGAGRFAGAFGREQANYFASAERSESERFVAGCPESGFNEYLQFGVETGLPGMLCLAATVVAAITVGMRRRDPYACGLTAAALFALFSYPFAILPLRLLFIVLLAGAATESTLKHTSRPIAGNLAACLLIIGTLWLPVLYARSVARAKAYATWQDTRIWITSERYDYLVEDGKKVYDRLKYDVRFLYDYGYALHKTGDYAHSNAILQRGMIFSSDPMFHNIVGKNLAAEGDLERAVACFKTAHNMIPSRLYPLYLIATTYRDAGRNQEACAAAQRALRLQVKMESEQTRELQRELREILNGHEIR